MVSFSAATLAVAAAFFSHINTSAAVPAPAPQADASAAAATPSASNAPAPLASSSAAVGNSTLGTSLAPMYNLFIDSQSWGSNTTSDINVYSGTPDTRRTRYYNWVISRGFSNIGGTRRPVILVNNQYPGPQLEANYGDTFVVDVKNNLGDDGTALHWHGLLQVGTQSMDGIPGVGQCPIAPGESRRYTFQADMYGSSWWHSHYSTQYSGGLVGPIVIHGPNQETIKYTADKGPVLLTDWSFKTYEQLAVESVGANKPGPVFSDISLINGKTNATFNFKTGDTYRMRLVNTAAEATYVFSIDEHEFTVFAHDFVPVQPYTAKNITLDVGQRADIVVKANGNANGSYWLRSVAADCSTVNNKTAFATIYYQNANRTRLPTTRPQLSAYPCVPPDAAIGVPVPVKGLSVPAKPAMSTTLNITFGRNSTGNPLWAFNNVSFRANYNQPPLLLAAAGNTTYPKQWAVINQGSNKTVEIIVYNHFFASHPLHLHGHNFWVVAQGFGNWDGKINVPNPTNPPRRDVWTIPGQLAPGTPAYTVFRYEQDNPGVWPFHCHIAWHVSGGLYVQMLERPADIKRQDQSAYDTCTGYVKWQQRGNIVNQIDSGE